MEKIVITRHPALVEYLREIGMIDESTAVSPHVNSPEEIAGKHVIGPCPLRLAAHAEQITEIPLTMPAELRGVELTLEQMRQYVGEPATYTVRRV